MKLENTNILIFKTQWPEKKIFSPEEFLKRKAPLEFEIGSGKGKFLVSRAEESPEINFIGIDRAGKWMKIGDRRGAYRKLEHIAFIKTEALEFMELLEPLCVDVFHMYFPDPWPKRRHRGRRLFTTEFVKILYSKLKPSGLIELATDDADYYEQMKKSVDQAEIPWEDRKETVNQRIRHPHLKTNYEMKFEAAGRNLYYMELKKKGSPS